MRFLKSVHKKRPTTGAADGYELTDEELDVISGSGFWACEDREAFFSIFKKLEETRPNA